MPRTVYEFSYDLNGQRPARSFVPHVAMRIDHEGAEAPYDTAMLLDTGAISDYTIAANSRTAVADHLGDEFNWHTARIRIAPLSELALQLSYSHNTLAHNPIASDARLLRNLDTLNRGARDANTMSLAYFLQAGVCIHMEPNGANDRTITEYYGPHNNGPRPVFSTDIKFPGGFPTLQHTMRADATASLYVETAVRGATATFKNSLCWDTGAEVCNVPANVLAAIGVHNRIVPKISVQNSGGNIVSFLNVPVDDDYDEVIMGATLFSLFSSAIQPGDPGKFGITMLQPATSITPVALPYESWT